ARAIVARHGDAVVDLHVSARLRMAMPGQDKQPSDESFHTIATMVDGTGLAVTSLSAIEPERIIARMLSAFGGDSVPKMDLTTEPSEVRMRLANGQEVPVRVVLRDEDLNLAFLKPIDALRERVAFVDGAGARPTPLDLLVIVTRLGESFGGQSVATFGYVQAVIDKPRIVYLLSGAMGPAFGTPVFDIGGRFVGIAVMRPAPPTSGRVGIMSSLSMLWSAGASDAMGILPVVRPAEDIREAARQAAAK